jgi:hypothetical protein
MKKASRLTRSVRPSRGRRIDLNGHRNRRARPDHSRVFVPDVRSHHPRRGTRRRLAVGQYRRWKRRQAEVERRNSQRPRLRRIHGAGSFRLLAQDTRSSAGAIRRHRRGDRATSSHASRSSDMVKAASSSAIATPRFQARRSTSDGGVILSSVP